MSDFQHAERLSVDKLVIKNSIFPVCDDNSINTLALS